MKELKFAELKAGMKVGVIFCLNGKRISWGQYLVINNPGKLPAGEDRPGSLLAFLNPQALIFLDRKNGTRMISWFDNNEPFDFFYQGKNLSLNT